MLFRFKSITVSNIINSVFQNLQILHDFLCNKSYHLSIHLLDSRPLRILCVLCHVIFLITFIDRYDCYPDFTNEETEAHIVEELTLGQHRFKTA